MTTVISNVTAALVTLQLQQNEGFYAYFSMFIGSAPEDIASYTAKVTVCDRFGNEKLIYSMSDGLAIVQVSQSEDENLPDGFYLLISKPPGVKELPAGRYYYDIKVTSPSPNITVDYPGKGEYEVIKSLTT